MLRILLWRFTFEALNLLKILGLRGPARHYFAYGANLDRAVLERRGITVYSEFFSVAPGFTLSFSHSVPFRGVGFATIEKFADKPNNQVPGIIYSMPWIDEKRMDRFEAYAFLKRYRKDRVTLDGKDCFFYHSGVGKPGLLPTKDYLDKILSGYRRHLPADSEFLTCLEKQPAIPTMVPKHPPEFLFDDYAKYGKWLAPFLLKYDVVCMNVFVRLILGKSLFQDRIPRN